MRQLTFIILFLGIFSGSLVRASSNHHMAVDKKANIPNIGKVKKNIQKYQEELKKDSLSAVHRFELVKSYMLLSDYQNAEVFGRSLLDLADVQPDYYDLLGSIYDSTSRFSNSYEIYNSGIEKFPNSSLLWYKKASSLYNMRLYAEAESIIIRAIGLDYTNASNHNLLSMIMYKQNERAKSIISLYSALALSPYSENSVNLYALLLEQLQKKEGLEVESSSTIYAEIDRELLKFAQEYDKNNLNRDRTEKFVDFSIFFFKLLGNNLAQENDQFWRKYTKIYIDILDKEYVEVLCYYISLCTHSKSAFNWLANNKHSLDQLFCFFRDYDFHPTL